MLNSFDVVVLILVCAGAYQGYRIGIISAAVFAMAGYAGTWLIRRALPHFGMALPLLFLFALAIFIGMFRYYKNKDSQKTYRLVIDRALGSLSGVLIILIMVGTVFLPFIHQLPGPSREKVFNSYSAMNIIPVVQQFFPEAQASVISSVHGVIVSLQQNAIQERRQKPRKKAKPIISHKSENTTPT